MKSLSAPSLALILLLACSVACAAESGPAASSRFTPLIPLPAPKIIGHAENYPGGNYDAQRILDGQVATEYSSNGKGIETFLAFDFGRPVRIGAFQHIDRRDPATVAESKLTFAGTADFDKPLGAASLRHANTPGGITFFALPQPITARYVTWQVTGLGPQKYGTVGGAEIKFFTAEDPEAAPVRDTMELVSQPAVVLQEGKPVRTVRVKIEHPYAEAVDAVLKVAGRAPQSVRLAFGTQSADFVLPVADAETQIAAAIEIGGRPVVAKELTLKPIRRWEIHLLSHSHVDIGYTNVQTEIEKLHWKYTDQALEIIRKTKDYPAGAQFKWNSEVLWAIDSYLRQAPPEKREQFAEAVKSGRLHLDGMYGNELTGLCRPEELFRLFGCARRLSQEYAVPIDAAMVSDVPGWTWGVVPAMAQSGIKYFSCGTNHVHRIGNTIEAWGDRPFYWVSPSGQEKVLCWVHGKGYSWFHINGRFEKVPHQAFFDYLVQLDSAGFPYDILPLRYSIDGDNGPPDAKLPDLVKAWNEKYVWPRMVISTTRDTFREFERRWGDKLPQARGDFTPYWEDGAGSSAKETATARTAAELLTQAEALWAMRAPSPFRKDDFYQAWKNVLLYNEHTWGAHCSIHQPDSDFTKAQWKIKQAFAVDGMQQAEKLFASAASSPTASGVPAAVDVYNTTSWSRTGTALLVLPSGAGADWTIKDSTGRAIASQQIGNGVLLFVATDVPGLGAKRYSIQPGKTPPAGKAKAEGRSLSNGRVRLMVDDKSGAIASLTMEGLPADLVNRAAGTGLNDYRYVAGRKPDKPQPSGPAKVHIMASGPLVASLAVESEAPGCHKLVRGLTVIDGLDGVEVLDCLDRQQVRTPEGVHIGFPLNVPGGVVRIDTPWAVVRPESDQLPGACKNYLSVGRWIDVSNDQFGLTCATLDAPLAEIGAIRMDVPSPFNPAVWAKKLEPTQRFFWYVMNNYWETNYKADQEGPTSFRYVLRPHGQFNQAAAIRFGIERSQPLVVVAVDPRTPEVRPLVRVEPPEVLVTSLKPSDDGKALLLRLWNADEKPARASLTWSGATPKRVLRSSPFEDEKGELAGPIELPSLGIVTLRAELP